jgi:hypothetical protein
MPALSQTWKLKVETVELQPIRFERCGVQVDTPEIRSELRDGFAQNDTLSP